MIPQTEEIGLEITTAKFSNKFSRKSPYISSTFSWESPKCQTGFHVSKPSPRHSNVYRTIGQIRRSKYFEYDLLRERSTLMLSPCLNLEERFFYTITNTLALFPTNTYNYAQICMHTHTHTHEHANEHKRRRKCVANVRLRLCVRGGVENLCALQANAYSEILYQSHHSFD